MNIQRFLPALLATLLAAPAWAQSAAPPLNLKLPPGALPASSSSAATAATPAMPAAPASAASSTASSAPGVYYGDTSGRMGNTEVASTRRTCDDSTYNQPQVHGSVGMGVVGGNHVSGNYQTGTVSVSKAFGSCDEPGGGVSFSISTGTGNFHSRGH